MEMALVRPRLISLAAGFTDNESLPVRETRALLKGILTSRETGQAALQYGTTVGDPVLRRLTARDLRRSDDARDSHNAYSPERLVVTNGSQQILYMVTEALCDPGDIVLVEDPTYPKLIKVAPELAGALDGYARTGGASGISVWTRKG